jgi:hypothetical protein
MNCTSPISQSRVGSLRSLKSFRSLPNTSKPPAISAFPTRKFTPGPSTPSQQESGLAYFSVPIFLSNLCPSFKTPAISNISDTTCKNPRHFHIPNHQIHSPSKSGNLGIWNSPPPITKVPFPLRSQTARPRHPRQATPHPRRIRSRSQTPRTGIGKPRRRPQSTLR